MATAHAVIALLAIYFIANDVLPALSTPPVSVPTGYCACWALMHELRGAEKPTLDYLLDRMQHCDLILIEGFKCGQFPKLEVWRDALGKSTLWPEWPGIVAIACDKPVSDAKVTQLNLSDVTSIASFALQHATHRKSS